MNTRILHNKRKEEKPVKNQDIFAKNFPYFFFYPYLFFFTLKYS